VEDLLAERGIIVSYEAVRRWCRKFGPDYARRLKRRQGRLGDTWYLDELFVRINGEQHYLWRAVDQDGDVIDILVQSRRDQRAAERFFRRLLRGQGKEPFRIISDKLKSYGAAQRTILPCVSHDTRRYANNQELKRLYRPKLTMPQEDHHVEQMKRMETIVAAKEIAEIEKKNRQNSPAATVPTVSPTIVENPVNFTSEELESKSSRIN